MNAIIETVEYKGPIYTHGHPPIIRNVSIAIITSPLKEGDVVQVNADGNCEAWDTTSPIYGVLLESCPASTTIQYGTALVHGTVREDAVLVAGNATMSPAIVQALHKAGFFVD